MHRSSAYNMWLMRLLPNEPPIKDDGSIGFNSNHLLYGGRRLHVLLSLLFNLMLIHGYTPVDLLQSSIISIPKDV